MQFDIVLTGYDEVVKDFKSALDASDWRVPSEVALVGFDDQYGVLGLMSLLTIIHAPNKGLGQLAAQQFLRGSAGEKGERMPRLETTPVIRRACGGMAVAGTQAPVVKLRR